MEVRPLALPGAFVFLGESHDDDRGGFDRLVDFGVLNELGLDSTVSQVSTARNARAGTLRGLHYQEAPDQESKTLWCTSGSLFDVLLDLREDLDTYGSWVSVELTSDEPMALHVPPGVAHGYQTTAPHTDLTYLISAPHAPQSARTIRWDDPTLAIPWPLAVTAISAKDAQAAVWRRHD